MCRVVDQQTASIKAEAPGYCRHHLEQAACYREVLEKVDRLILVGEVVMKGDRGRNDKRASTAAVGRAWNPIISSRPPPISTASVAA